MYDLVYSYDYNTLDAPKRQNGDTNIPIVVNKSTAFCIGT